MAEADSQNTLSTETSSVANLAQAELDVQRMELPALRGAKDILVRDKPVLMVETPDEPIMSFLDVLGDAPCYYVDGKLTADPPWVLHVLFIA